MASFLMGSLSPTNVLLFLEKGSLFDVIYALQHNRMISFSRKCSFCFFICIFGVRYLHLHEMSGKI